MLQYGSIWYQNKWWKPVILLCYAFSVNRPYLSVWRTSAEVHARIQLKYTIATATTKITKIGNFCGWKVHWENQKRCNKMAVNATGKHLYIDELLGALRWPPNASPVVAMPWPLASAISAPLFCYPMLASLLSLLCLLDLSKAFNCVPNKEFLSYLSRFSISHSWFSSCLENCTQAVKLENTCFDPLQVISRVPQGSILGPAFFILYINNILANLTPASSDTKVATYADDSQTLDKCPREDLPRCKWEKIWSMWVIVIWSWSWKWTEPRHEHYYVAPLHCFPAGSSCVGQSCPGCAGRHGSEG